MILKTLLYMLIFSFFTSLFANGAVVFMYHRFDESKYPSTSITTKQFQYQLDYLEKNNYNVWHISKILRYIKAKKPIPPKTVALTIDDAYISVYKKAYPLLKKKNFPFSVMVNTNPVDNKSESYMSWDMMREMKANKAEFANHSQSHDYLTHKKNETDEAFKKRLTKEVLNAQLRLQEELGEDTNENPKLFVYPFGEFSIKSAEFLKELDYIGVTQTSGAVGESSDLMSIRRFPMSETFATKDGFKTKLNTLPMPIDYLSPFEPTLKEENPPKLLIKLKRPLKNLKCYMSSGEPIPIKWFSDTEFIISANRTLKKPREKYTCTAPAPNKKWYWYSHLWIIK